MNNITIEDPKFEKISVMENRMELLLYSATKQQAGERIQNIIEGIVPIEDIGICRTIESLSIRLRQFRNDLSLAIILASTQKELVDVVFIRELLDDIPIILILPDRKKETISTGSKLRPRFLGYMDSDFQDVKAVLDKMVSRFIA